MKRARDNGTGKNNLSVYLSFVLGKWFPETDSVYKAGQL